MLLLLQGFQKELQKRSQSIGAVRQSAKQLLAGGVGAGGQTGDETMVQTQLIALTTRWEAVCRLSVSRQQRLEAASEQVQRCVDFVIGSFNLALI